MTPTFTRAALAALCAALVSCSPDPGSNAGGDPAGGGTGGAGGSAAGDPGGDTYSGDDAPPGDSFSCPACLQTEHCANGGVCTAGQVCEPHPEYDALCTPCTQANPCPAGMGCVLDPAATGQRYCVAACDTGADCPKGYANCLGSPLPGPEYCSAASQCSDARQCVTLSGQQFCECRTAADCDVFGGWACSVDQCFTAPCSTDADCIPLGVTCDTSNGVCDLPCTSDDDCICLAGNCAFTGVPCATAADCAMDCAQVPIGATTAGLCVTESWYCSKDPSASCAQLTGGSEPCPGL